MKFTDKKLILFYLDGTLIDSVPDLTLAVNEMLSALGRETFSEETVRYWVGNGAKMLVTRALLGKREVNEEVDEVLFEQALDLFLNFYKKHLPESTVPYPHVKETLRSLKKKGYRLAIITNKPFAFVGLILQGLGLDDLFKLVLGGDSLPQKKPDPALLMHACRTLKVTVAQSLMVGDSKNDLLAAKACGMRSISVTYGYNYGEDIVAYGPDVIVDDFADILNFFA